MTSFTEAIHEHHLALSTELAALATALGGAPDAAENLVEFLRAELLPHARGEERHLYPAIDPLIRAHGEPTATMRVDHAFIEEYARRIADLAGAMHTTNPDDRPALARQVERLAIGLEALLEVHLAKEERVYLPLAERYLPADEQRRILDAMHDGHQDAPAAGHPSWAERA